VRIGPVSLGFQAVMRYRGGSLGRRFSLRGGKKAKSTRGDRPFAVLLSHALFVKEGERSQGYQSREYRGSPCYMAETPTLASARMHNYMSIFLYQCFSDYA